MKLSLIIDWDGLEADLSSFYCAGTGRPAGPIRLMTGLCFLKDIKGLSYEEICTVWCKNPISSIFVGQKQEKIFFQNCFPVEPPSVSIFRRRISEEGIECLLGETIKVVLQSGTLSKRDLRRVTVDASCVIWGRDRHKTERGHVDLGYRGHGIKDDDMEIILARRKRGITPAIRKRQKWRNVIEPIIGHCKNDHKIGLATG